MYSMVRNDTERRYVTQIEISSISQFSSRTSIDDRIDIIQDEPKKSKENYDDEL